MGWGAGFPRANPATTARDELCSLDACARPLPGWMHATLTPIAADRTIKVVLPPR
jgi:hypothetical protein